MPLQLAYAGDDSGAEPGTGPSPIGGSPVPADGGAASSATAPTGTALPLSTSLPLGTGNYPGVRIGDVVRGQGATGVVATIQGIFDTAKQIVGPILVFLIAGFGIKLMLTGGNEEEFSKVSKHFLYLLVGTAFIIFAKFLSDTFTLYYAGTAEQPATFVSGTGEILQATGNIRRQVGIVIKFLRYILGGVALLYVVKSGGIIIFNPEEETVSKQKEIFMYGFAGFLLVMVSEALINVVFNIRTLPEISVFTGSFVRTGIDVGGGLSLITNVTNLFLATLSGLFLFTLVVGGVMYALSAGNEERGQKATKIIIGSLVGLVIAFSSYTIVYEFSAGGREAIVAPGGVIELLPSP